MKKHKKLRKAKRKFVKRFVAESDYKKARKNALNRLSYYRVQGYDVSSIKIPDIPKRITIGSVKKLEKINADYIRKNSKVVTAVNLFTGEPESFISGEDYYKLKKTYKKKKTAKRKSTGTTRKTREKQKESFDNESSSGTSYPHMLDLMRDKIEGMIANYNIGNSNFASMLRDWLDNANMDGLTDRLLAMPQTVLVDLDKDLYYVSIGRRPKGYGIEAIHNALLNRPMSAEEWNKVNNAFEEDNGADMFDEEAFFGSTDD